MSYSISASYNDQQLSQIRNLVERRPEKIPYVLLPVRLETRFMDVPDTPDVDLSWSLSFLQKFSELHELLLDTTYNPRLNSLKKTVEAARNLKSMVALKNTCAAEEKTLLNQALQQFNTEKLVLEKKTALASGDTRSTPGGLSGRTSRINIPSRPLQSSISAAEVIQYKELLLLIDNINTSVKLLKPEKKSDTSELQIVLKELNRLDKEIVKWFDGPKKIPYTNIKNKKDLYSYFFKIVNEANVLTRRISGIPQENIQITKNQWDRVDALCKQIAINLEKSSTIIKNLHKDRHWQEFVEKKFSLAAKEAANNLQLKSQAFLANSKKLIGQTLPKATMLHAYLSGINTLIQIKRFNHQSNISYSAISSYQKHLKKNITQLSILRKNFRPDQKFVSLFTSLFDQASIQLNAGISKTNIHPVLNKSQKYGRDLLIAFQKNVAKAVIADWQRTDLFPSGTKTATQKTKKQLWVRIYPDDIFVKTHEADLSQEEIKAGKAFWKYWWCASGDRELELAAWRILCSVLGTRRASWVAKSLDPRSIAFNKGFLTKKPSLITLQALQFIQEIVKDLNTIQPDGTLTDWLPATTTIQLFNNVYQHLVKMANILPAVKKEQINLGDRLRFGIIQTASVLEILIGIVNKADQVVLNDPSLRNGLVLLKEISVQFQSIQQAFNKVTWMEFETFIAALPDFPTYPAVKEKKANWTKAPYTDILPKRFVVIAKRGGQFIHLKVGNNIPPEVQLGLNPESFDNKSLFFMDDNADLKLDPGMEWMAYYPKAVEIGLGISLDITREDYELGFEQIIVLGLSDKNANESAQLLENLIENHLYSPDGMSFLKIGIATNNTSDKTSGYSTDEDVEESFDIEINGNGFDKQTIKWDKQDGKIFAETLSLPLEMVSKISGRNNREISAAKAMNKILWPATFGHNMEEMWDYFFPYDNIRRTEDFFTNWVSGRGHVPSVRIGTQPYGVLVTTAYSRFSTGTVKPDVLPAEAAMIMPWGVTDVALDNKLQTRYNIRLWELLKFLEQTWTELRKSKVIHAGNMKVNGNDDEQRFIEMLGLHAHAIDYYFRYGANLNRGMKGLQPEFSTWFNKDDEYGPVRVFERVKELAIEGIYSPSFKFSDEDESSIRGLTYNQILDAKFSRIKNQIENNRLFTLRLGEENLVLQDNLVQLNTDANEFLSSLEGKDVNYLSWLLDQTCANLLGGNDFGNKDRIPDNSLLFFLLRQGLLQAYQKAALDILQLEQIIDEQKRRLVGSKDKYYMGGFYYTKWHFLFKDLSDLVDEYKIPPESKTNPFYIYINSSITSMARYLDRVRSDNPEVHKEQHKKHFNSLKQYREALDYLKRFPVGELERMMAEHIDICSYRLDAWQNAFAAKRLHDQRNNSASGIFIGAFGYVENLVADKNKTLTSQNLNGFKLPKGKPVYHDPDNQGFIHAPSITHAVTAAVLRNAYTNNREEGDVENRLSVNLSSSRVRMALNLIEGMRNGQETGAVLGFQFERGLHERFSVVELDRYIQPFRKAYPLQQAVAEAAPGTKPAYISVVPDGMAMLDDVYKSIDWIDPATNASKDKTVAALLKENLYSKLPVKIKSTIDSELTAAEDKTIVYDNIIAEIDRMADAFDALGDLALSESVYQMVAGNHVRAGAVLDALAEGRVIPAPDIIRTPRTGSVLTHRILLNIRKRNSKELPAHWTFANSVKAMVEPSMNYWLGEILGNPANIKFVLRIKDHPNAAEVIVNKTLDEFDLQPIDIFSIPGKMDELIHSLIGLYRLQEQDFHSVISINPSEKSPGVPSTIMSLEEMFITLQHISDMISNARMGGSSDFEKASDNTSFAEAGNYNLVELENRIQAGSNTLRLYISKLESESYISQITSGSIALEEITLTTLELNDIIDNLNIAMYMGFPNAMNLPIDGNHDGNENARACLRQLLRQLKEAKNRESEFNKTMAGLPPASNPRLRVEKLTEIAKLLLGKNFRINPCFAKKDISAVNQQLNLPISQKISRHNGLLAVENWLQQIARVRPRMTDLQRYRRLANAFDMADIKMQPAQLPYKDGDYWMGIAYPSNFSIEGDVTSLFLLNDDIIHDTEQCAMVIDEWHEVIPGTEETTGIAFHYNQPDSTAPQAVLVAVSPAADEKWIWDDLVFTITDTIEMAKNRAVEPDHLEKSWLNQILPSIYAEVVREKRRTEPGNHLGVQAVMDFANIKNKD